MYVRLSVIVIIFPQMHFANINHPLHGSHTTWKTLKTWNFAIYFSRSGKDLEFAQNVIKTWNFRGKPGIFEKIILFVHALRNFVIV